MAKSKISFQDSLLLILTACVIIFMATVSVVLLRGNQPVKIESGTDIIGKAFECDQPICKRWCSEYRELHCSSIVDQDGKPVSNAPNDDWEWDALNGAWMKVIGQTKISIENGYCANDCETDSSRCGFTQEDDDEWDSIIEDLEYEIWDYQDAGKGSCKIVRSGLAITCEDQCRYKPMYVLIGQPDSPGEPETIQVS